jgi:hypothetical protein
MRFTLLVTLLALLPIADVSAADDWQQAYPIQQLTPKRKLGGLVRFNDPSFFFAEEGKLVTYHGRYKRHRTFMFPHLPMNSYPYTLKVRVKKRDNFPVMAGFIFGAKTPYEFEMGSEPSHGALMAYVGDNALELRDHRTYDTAVWKGAASKYSGNWQMEEEVTLELTFTNGGANGRVSATVSGAVQANIEPRDIDLGKPDELTNQPHVRGKGYWGFAVHGQGEVEILEVAYEPGSNQPETEGLEAYLRPCEWCVLKQSKADYITMTFALREAAPTSIVYLQDGTWSQPVNIPETSHERDGGHTMYTIRGEWTGSRPTSYRLAQGATVIYEGRIPAWSDGWDDNRTVVGLGVGGNEVWRYKQQNQLNWFDHILTQDRWQGDPPEVFGRLSHNLGDNGTEFMKYQGVNNGWPDFLFGGDDYPGYPDNPILTIGELDYQQRMWDVMAICEPMRDFHGNVPSAFKGGDHEFANSDQLQPGGFRGEYFPEYIKNAYRATSVEGMEPIHPDEFSHISRPVPGWIEVFHMVTRFNQTIAINTAEFPAHVERVPAQSPSGLYVMEQLEEWARTSPAPFKIVHQDHPLGDIRDVSAKESYRLYPWERGAMIRLIAETGLIYAMGDEHNLRLVKYTDFSTSMPEDPRLAPLKNMSIYELGISNMSGEWFRHVRENEPSTDGFAYDVLYQSVPKTEKIAYDGYQVRNGYTTWRFHKNSRTFDFEIWQRNGEGSAYPARDPRREKPNYSHTLEPRDIYWKTSMLPVIDLTDAGLNRQVAANMAYSIHNESGDVLFSNRADAQGKIQGMPCPPMPPGARVRVVPESGRPIWVTTE